VGKVSSLEDRPLSYRRAMERIRLLWKDGLFLITPHAQKRMRERGFDTPDIEHLIHYGHVVDHSKPGGLWRYKVQGRLVDGEGASCVVEINGNLIVVTVIG